MQISIGSTATLEALKRVSRESSSRSDIRDDGIGAPQRGQISRFPVSGVSLCGTDLRHLDTIPLFQVRIDLIAIVLLFVIGSLVTQCRECRPFTLVSPDDQQLLPNRVFGDEALLNVSLK